MCSIKLALWGQLPSKHNKSHHPNQDLINNKFVFKTLPSGFVFSAGCSTTILAALEWRMYLKIDICLQDFNHPMGLVRSVFAARETEILVF